MKILVFANIFPPDIGGASMRAYNVVNALRSNGNEVTVITSFPHYPTGKIPNKYKWKFFYIENESNLRILRTFLLPIPSSGLTNRLVIFLNYLLASMLVRIKVHDYDVIWTANPNVLSFVPAKFYSIFRKKPIVMNIDDLWPEDVDNFGMTSENSMLMKVGTFLASFAYKNSSHLTPISPGYLRILKTKYRINTEKKATVIFPGVDLTQFAEQELPTAVQKDKKFQILYAGAFSIAYDFNQILLAAKILEGENMEFLLHGAGECLDNVKSKIAKYGIHNVKISENYLTRDEVTQLISNSDALILPSRKFKYYYYGLPSKIFEYQAAGKPIICCSNGFPGQFIEETKSGVVVESGDYRSLAKSILWLKSNPEISKMLGKNGRTYAENNASIQKIGTQIMEVFQKILTKPRQDEISINK
jgi:glycosyltransferase involved in cell wall biosynthesis